MDIRWSPAAADDFERITWYVKENLPSRAPSIVDRLYATIQRLRKFPHLGRQGRVPGTRELVVTRFPYVVIYDVSDDAISVVRVLHAAQEWPPSTD